MALSHWLRALPVAGLVAFEWTAHLLPSEGPAASRGVAAPLLSVAGAAVHTAIYVFLLVVFGRTLRRGKDPLITRLARNAHGTLMPAMETYTRRATLAWCVFFVAQLVLSAGLLAFASPGAWSAFINLLNLPLLVAMFAGEHLYRITFHPEFPRASLPMVIGSFVKEGTSARGADSR